jgi:hypothetical protein
MSKVSEQQPSTPRDRTAPAAPRPKQSGRADTNGNGAKKAAPRDVQPTPAIENGREYGVVPTESAEDEFFARGELNSSFPPAAVDVIAPELEEDVPESQPLTPAQLERRARLRRIVGGVVGAAAVLTAVVGAKALSAPHAKVTASEGALNVPHHVVPSIAIATPDEAKAANTPPSEPTPSPVATAAVEPAAGAQDLAAQEGAAEPRPDQAENAATESAAAATPRRLPVIDVEIPASVDAVTNQQWESAAKNLASKDFKGADSAFAELGKRSDLATREAARLARAVWWTANGRQSEVKPVLADLAANATTPSVRQHARELLRTN